MERYGLLGRSLSHSLSPQIHSFFGDYPYDIIEREPAQLEELFANSPYKGFNVTIPYKKTVMPLCTKLDETAVIMGSVNTVCFENGEIVGYNTDCYGFCYLLDSNGIDVCGRKTLVLGSGGASATVCTVLKERGADVTVISRTGEDNYENIANHYDARCIINTTPVGMYPNNMQAPLSLDGFEKLEAVVDIIYNPLKTALLLQAEARGVKHANGLSMLVAQGKRASELFRCTKLSDSVTENTVKNMEAQFSSVVLVGMPGCGKSTVGALLANKLGKTFLDTDALTEEAAGKSIPEIMERDGVEVFRDIEESSVAAASKTLGAVVATGGGVVLRAQNRVALRQNAKVIFLSRDIEALSTKGRPLSKNIEALQAMYAERLPLYRAVSHVEIPVQETPDATVAKIMEVLK